MEDTRRVRWGNADPGDRKWYPDRDLRPAEILTDDQLLALLPRTPQPGVVPARPYVYGDSRAAWARAAAGAPHADAVRAAEQRRAGCARMGCAA
jgi:hypothetical protein